METYSIEALTIYRILSKKEFKLYKNDYQPAKKKIKFTRSLKHFNDAMTKYLKEGKI